MFNPEAQVKLESPRNELESQSIINTWYFGNKRYGTTPNLKKLRPNPEKSISKTLKLIDAHKSYTPLIEEKKNAISKMRFGLTKLKAQAKLRSYQRIQNSILEESGLTLENMDDFKEKFNPTLFLKAKEGWVDVMDFDSSVNSALTQLLDSYSLEDLKTILEEEQETNNELYEAMSQGGLRLQKMIRQLDSMKNFEESDNSTTNENYLFTHRSEAPESIQQQLTVEGFERCQKNLSLITPKILEHIQGKLSNNETITLIQSYIQAQDIADKSSEDKNFDMRYQEYVTRLASSKAPAQDLSFQIYTALENDGIDLQEILDSSFKEVYPNFNPNDIKTLTSLTKQAFESNSSTYINGFSFDGPLVDELSALNEAGIKTNNHCSGKVEGQEKVVVSGTGMLDTIEPEPEHGYYGPYIAIEPEAKNNAMFDILKRNAQKFGCIFDDKTLGGERVISLKSKGDHTNIQRLVNSSLAELQSSKQVQG